MTWTESLPSPTSPGGLLGDVSLQPNPGPLAFDQNASTPSSLNPDLPSLAKASSLPELEPELLATTSLEANAAAIGGGNGLQGKYYNNINFSDLAVTRTDATVDFVWGNGSPDSRIDSDTFSVRWTGQVQPLYSEDYRFFTTSDDGVRLKINGQSVIDRYIDQAPTTVNGRAIRLEAGKKYNIQLDYYENRGGAVAKLGWQSNSQSRQIIPTSQLFSSGGSNQPPSISLAQDSYEASESAGSTRLTIERTGNLSQASSVQYRLFDGTAKAGSDYVSKQGTVNFAIGQTQTTIPITLLNDRQEEPTETLNVTLVSPTGATLGTRRTALLNILDDDNPNGNSTGLRGEYFDSKNFTNRKLVRDDGTINFDWGGGSPDSIIGSDTFSARWTGKIQPRYSEEYTFYTTADDGVRLFIDGKRITNDFTDHSARTSTGKIRLNANQKYDIKLEYFENGGNASAKLEWSSNRQNREIVPQSRLSIPSNGGPPGRFQVGETRLSVNEGDGNASVVINRLNGSSGNVSINYSTLNGGAKAGSDYRRTQGTLSFADGEISKTLVIPLIDNAQNEFNEAFRLRLSQPTGGATLDSRKTSTITIIDNDDMQFANDVFARGLSQPTAFGWSPDQSLMFVAQKAGQVKVINQGTLQASNFIDLSDEVNGTRDRGLLGIAVHPEFSQGKPFVYLGYTYDPPEADRTGRTANPLDDADGRGNRPSRVVRITAEQRNGNWVAKAGSKVVILGRNSTWANTNGTDGNSTTDLDIPPSGIRPNGTNIQDYLATDSESHTIGQLRFGTDGALYVSNGDGAAYNEVDPRAKRVRDIDNLSGKLLRINPINGRGLSDNPFYNGRANSNRSKVYAYGFRNPFRFTINQQTGQPFVGDVGWFTWEEVNAVEAGKNYGWPLYEGASGKSSKTVNYKDNPEIKPLYAGVTDLKAPIFGLPHKNLGGDARAIVMGDFYTGNSFPDLYQNTLFINDANTGKIQALAFNNQGKVRAIKDFGIKAPGAVQFSTGKDGNLYYASLGTGEIRRFRPNGASTITEAGGTQSERLDFQLLDLEDIDLENIDIIGRPDEGEGFLQ